MKKAIAIGALGLSFAAGAAFAAKVRDWHDLDAARNHIQKRSRK